MASNFEKWLEEADIPTLQNGRWVDLETGIPYDAGHDYADRAPRKALSASAADARQIAKSYGGRALVGTARQKEWAEKIRAQKLAEMTRDQAELVCDPKGLLNTAKFWIENRLASGSSIGEFVMQQKAMLVYANAMKTQCKAEEYAAIAAEYNALTSKLGF